MVTLKSPQVFIMNHHRFANLFDDCYAALHARLFGERVKRHAG